MECPHCRKEIHESWQERRQLGKDAAPPATVEITRASLIVLDRAQRMYQ